MLLMKSAVFEKISNFQESVYEALVRIGSTPGYIPFYGFQLSLFIAFNDPPEKNHLETNLGELLLGRIYFYL